MRLIYYVPSTGPINLHTMFGGVYPPVICNEKSTIYILKPRITASKTVVKYTLRTPARDSITRFMLAGGKQQV